MTTRYPKRHYEDVARIIKDSSRCLCILFEQVRIAQVDRFDRCDIVAAFIDLFAGDNPQFDPARFLAACELESEGQTRHDYHST